MLASFSMGDKLSTAVVHHIVQATVVLHSGLHQGLHFVLLSDVALLGEYRVLPQVSVDGISYLLQYFPFPTGATTTLLPSRASSFDMARPIPVLSPVTTDTLPENSDGCRKRENPLWSRDFIKMAIQCKLSQAISRNAALYLCVLLYTSCHLWNELATVLV